MNHLSLFSGIGGIDLAAHWAGMKTVAFCEREPFPQKVLKKHWPDVPIYDDVCTLTKERLEADGIDTRTIDIISAGYPCQPFSVAGNRAGKEDDRHLWPEVARLLRQLKPRWFLGENVAGHITLGLDDVLIELESIGYTAQAFVIPSASVGAPHRRDRVFVVGYTEHNGSSWTEVGRSSDKTSYDNKEGKIKTSESKGTSGFACNENVANTKGERSPKEREYQCGRPEERSAWSSEIMANTNRQGMERSSLSRSYRGNRKRSRQELAQRLGEDITRRAAQPELGGVLDGLSDWLDRYKWPAGLGAEQYDWEPPRVATGVKDRVGRLKGLGNAVNPVQAYPVLASIKAIDDSLTLF
ncbi:putative BsuMI modification methylase subunit YdiP [compost metagenome]